MEFNSPEMISGNHVADFCGNPNEIKSTDEKLPVIFLEGGVSGGSQDCLQTLAAMALPVILSALPGFNPLPHRQK